MGRTGQQPGPIRRAVHAVGTLADYMREGHATVPGSFDPADQRVFAAISDAQHSVGVCGDLLEIGTFMGRSAVLLGYLVDEDEQLVVCDLFDGPATNEHSARENAATYVGLTEADFKNTYGRFHPTLPTIVTGPSAGLVDFCEPGATGSCTSAGPTCTRT